MNKFKVGDFIKGTKNSPYHITNENMYLGEVTQVDKCGNINVKILNHKYKHRIGERYPLLCSKYFKLAFPADNYEIRIYCDGNKVIAENTITGEKGVARCCPEDEFDFDYGAKLALRRLTAAQVGDKVKIVADNCFHRFENGTILTIDSVEERKTLHRYHPKENKDVWITEYDFVKCTEKDLLYNGKVVCIETPFSDKLTVGKIYTFTDGYLTFDNGERTMTRYRSFEDLTKRFKAKFLEVVE